MTTNPVIAAVRDSFDPGDAYSCATLAAFACGEGLCLAGEWIPDDWKFRPSPMLAGYSGRRAARYMASEYGETGRAVWRALQAGDDETVRQSGRAMLMLTACIEAARGER